MDWAKRQPPKSEQQLAQYYPSTCKRLSSLVPSNYWWQLQHIPHGGSCYSLNYQQITYVEA